MMVEARSMVPLSGRLMPKSPRRMEPPLVRKMFCIRGVAGGVRVLKCACMKNTNMSARAHVGAGKVL